MKQSISNRLKQLENAPENNDYEIIRLIKSGLSYDKLTDEQKTAYCHYHNTDREAFEEVNRMVFDTTDVELQLKPPPMTPEEERKHIDTVAKEIEEFLKNPENQEGS